MSKPRLRAVGFGFSGLALLVSTSSAADRTWPRWQQRRVALDQCLVRWAFRIYYTLTGEDALLAKDRADSDEDGLPDRIQNLARQLVTALKSVDKGSVSSLEDRPFKARYADEYAEAVRRIQEHGISVNGCFILGADTQTPASFKRVATFAEEVGLAEVQVTVLTPFPGTPLYERLLSQGRILKPGDWGGCTLFDVNFEPARMSVRELEEGLLDLFGRLYTQDARRTRQRKFHAQVRAGRRHRHVA